MMKPLGDRKSLNLDNFESRSLYFDSQVLYHTTVSPIFMDERFIVRELYNASVMLH